MAGDPAARGRGHPSRVHASRRPAGDRAVHGSLRALIGTLPAQASEEQALAWIDRQRGERLAQRRGLSFAIAEADTNLAVGQIGLWLAELPQGRATAGYFVGPSARGRGIAAAALVALTRFAWTIPDLHRIELYIEPWNVASTRTAERAGYEREACFAAISASEARAGTCCSTPP